MNEIECFGNYKFLYFESSRNYTNYKNIYKNHIIISWLESYKNNIIA